MAGSFGELNLSRNPIKTGFPLLEESLFLICKRLFIFVLQMFSIIPFYFCIHKCLYFQHVDFLYIPFISDKPTVFDNHTLYKIKSITGMVIMHIIVPKSTIFAPSSCPSPNSSAKFKTTLATGQQAKIKIV